VAGALDNGPARRWHREWGLDPRPTSGK